MPTSGLMRGGLLLALHAHLPFVRHPEHAEFHEETWLFEAIAECYLPLWRHMAGWTRDGLPWRLTLTLTPTLCAQLRDDLLRARFVRHLERLQELAEREQDRLVLEPTVRRLAADHAHRLAGLRRTWDEVDGDLVGAFGRFRASGHLDILTCAATHAVLPLLLGEAGSIRAQLRTAVRDHIRHLGSPPRGIWLPECAYDPALERPLAEAGLRWFLLETHGLLQADPPPPAAVFAPVRTPGGALAFGRDPSSARQVWSRECGYPGDPRYREFHRDLSHDAEWHYVAPYLSGAANRSFTGLKYHRVTGRHGAKEWYDPEAARDAVREHAAHFVEQRRHQIAGAQDSMSTPPVVVAPYDAELFGHWWAEGPDFLDRVVRLCCSPGSGVPLVHAPDLWDDRAAYPTARPAASTWGEGGHLGVWLDASNAGLQPALRRAATRLTLAAKRADGRPESTRRIHQAARELLLAQSSDWPFLIRMGTASDYARRRFDGHLEACLRLLGPGDLKPGELEELEAQNNLFPEVDYRDWLPG